MSTISETKFPIHSNKMALNYLTVYNYYKVKMNYLKFWRLLRGWISPLSELIIIFIRSERNKSGVFG